jgi:dolichyl-phosphate-mannose-protein mannosyltransferase
VETGAPAPEVAADPKADSKAKEQVTPGQAAEGVVVEEAVEYRDEKGNLLNEEQAKELEGKVSFSTKHAARNVTVDSKGRSMRKEVNANDGAIQGSSHAPAHPDAEMQPETSQDRPEAHDGDKPASASPEDDIKKEKSAEKDKGKPKPASDAKPATK